MGLLSVFVTRFVYWVEDLFEHLPIHWMWWPAIGGLAVGAVGILAPRTLGVASRPRTRDDHSSDEYGQGLARGEQMARYFESMPSGNVTLSAALAACAPLPALIIGIVAMRQLGVSTLAWSINIAAAVLGLLLWTVGRRLPPLTGRGTRAWLTAASIAAILLPFASAGVLGVYRWVSVAGLRLHASAIVAPLIILCVAVAASHGIGSALAISVSSAIILALQPDAAQTVSLAAACTVILICAGTRKTSLGIVLLVATSAASFLRHDPLPPVDHVERIYGIVASRGPGFATMATMALLLLPVPFFAAWHRHRQPIALALGVYIAMTLLAPAWGTFPVPVMGYGASPILGYFIALAASTNDNVSTAGNA